MINQKKYNVVLKMDNITLLFQECKINAPLLQEYFC